MMKIKEQNLTQAGAVLLVSAIIVKLIGAFFKIPLSSDFALGDLGFGYFSAVYDLFIPVSALALSGFPVAIAGMLADYNAKRDAVGAANIFKLSFKVLLCLGIIGTAVFCSAAILKRNSDNAFYSLLAIAPAVLFCCIASVYRGYFEGLKNMVPTAVSNIIEALLKLGLGLTGAVITVRLTGKPALASAAALLGITIGTLISCVYLSIRFKKSNAIIKTNGGKKQRELLLELTFVLIPVAIASLSVGITAFIDSLTLRPQLEALIVQNPKNAVLLLKGTSYTSVNPAEIPTLLYGIKGKAYTLFNLVPTLTTAFGVGAVPLVAQCFAEGNRQELRKNINLCLKLSAVLSFPIAFGFIAIGQPITELLYGSKSAALGGQLLTVYGAAALFAGLTIPTTSLLQAGQKQKRALLNIICGLAVKLLCNLGLTAIAPVNVMGIAISTALCFGVIFVLNIVSIVKAFGVVPDFNMCFLRPLFSAFLCSVAAFLTVQILNSAFGTIIGIFFAGIVFLLSLFLLKVITENEIAELIKK